MAKERDHSVTAKLQVQIVIKIDIFEKKPFKTIFSAGLDTISPGTQNRTTKLAIGALFAPEIPHVPSIGINPYNILILMVSDILMDPVFGELFQEFSIGQVAIDTKKEPELGGSGNWGLKNAGSPGLMKLGSTMVRGGFLMEGVTGRRWKRTANACDGVGKKSDIIYRYTGPQVKWLWRNKYL